jgi:alcohol dehydrogenase (NADP+)
MQRAHERELMTIIIHSFFPFREAMEALVDQGLARALGVCNFSLAAIESLLSSSRIKPLVAQAELHPLCSQRKLVGTCLRKGVHFVAHSPLPEDLLRHPGVVQVAEETGKAPEHVILKWNVQRGVAVAVGAGALAAAGADMFSWRLGWDQKSVLDQLDEGRRFVTVPWHAWEEQ